MKVGIFVNPKRPKIPVEKILKHIQSAGIPYSQEDPDIAVVVGGDGTFGYCGRILSVPLLFVGVQESWPVGSKAKLAEVFYSDLIEALHHIQDGKYCVLEKKMLSVRLKKDSVDVLTDVYLERGEYAGCLRYAVTVKPIDQSNSSSFSDYAIGNGVIISTSFGAGGYFSYSDRLWSGARETIGPKSFGDDKIGICHIIPVYLARKNKSPLSYIDKIRYTVSRSSGIQIKLLRDAKSRLYGTTVHSKGIRVGLGDTIIVTPSKRTAKIIKLRK